MKTISIVIQTMKDMHLTGQRMGSIVGLAGHAGVAEIVSGHSGDRTAGIAERCGVRHGLHTRDRVASCFVVAKGGDGGGGVFCVVCLRAVPASGGEGWDDWRATMVVGGRVMKIAYVYTIEWEAV